MTEEDILVFLLALNILLSVLILGRLGSTKRELTKLRRKRIFRESDKKRAKPL